MGGGGLEGLAEALRCLEERLGDFTAFLVGSRARGDARPLSSDVDIVVIVDRIDPLAQLCCEHLPHDCDLIQVELGRVGRLLEALSMPLIEALSRGVPLRLGGNWPEVRAAWERFLEGRVVEWRGDYVVVRRRDRPTA